MNDTKPASQLKSESMRLIHLFSLRPFCLFAANECVVLAFRSPAADQSARAALDGLGEAVEDGEGDVGPAAGDDVVPVGAARQLRPPGGLGLGQAELFAQAFELVGVEGHRGTARPDRQAPIVPF